LRDQEYLNVLIGSHAARKILAIPITPYMSDSIQSETLIKRIVDSLFQLF